MKKFYYNTLVSKEDFADRKEDITSLTKFLTANKKIALYAPRRYGKSSLASVILPDELSRFKKSYLYVDFMGCSTIESAASRLTEAYAQCLQRSFKKDYLIKSGVSLLKNLSLIYEADPLSGEMSVGLKSKNGNNPKLNDILESIINLAKDHQILIACDEFQDLLEVPECLAIFRSQFQKLKSSPILFLGSKRKLLSQIFSSNESPFFNFADEYVLSPISVEDWIPYFKERLQPVKTSISAEALQYLCGQALDVPNTICEIGSYIQDNYQGIQIDKTSLSKILADLILKKSESYKYQMSMLTNQEVKLCKALAHFSFSKGITSKDFLKVAEMGASTALKISKKLYKNGIIEEETQGYRISNPLLSLYLKYSAY